MSVFWEIIKNVFQRFCFFFHHPSMNTLTLPQSAARPLSSNPSRLCLHLIFCMKLAEDEMLFLSIGTKQQSFSLAAAALEGASRRA